MIARIKLLLVKLYYWPARLWDNILLKRYTRTLDNIVESSSPSYQQYLQLQLKRTFIKRKSPLQERTRVFVDRLAKQVDLHGARVLCIGCRNTAEVDYIHIKGCHDVVGIDLHSQRDDILVMDMHHMKFTDGFFDIIYSSHSLEHSQNPDQVIHEIIRVARPGALVAIEVPVEFEPRGADLVDFKSLNLLHEAFSPYLSEVLWSEQYQASGVERNNCIRTIFRIHK